jgi:hypothetical protein
MMRILTAIMIIVMRGPGLIAALIHSVLGALLFALVGIVLVVF